MPEPPVPRILSFLLPVLVVLLLAACSDPEPSADPTGATSESGSEAAAPSDAPPGFVLVAIGDSIPYNLEGDCPGCTGFVDSYAGALEDEVGEPVAVLNRSRHDGARTIDIVEQLQSDDGLLAELATADVIVMSVGFNDQPPYADAHDGCPEPVTDSDPLSTAVERAAATSHDCIDTVVQAIRGQIAEVFAGLRVQAPDAAIGALTAYDSWLGWSELDAVDKGTRKELYAAVRYWMHEWRDALCDEAEAVGAVCVDVYTAFNGPDGDQPPADFVAADHTHPSQVGNDVIRDLLIGAGLTRS
jgi:lysophospholipase L1-like esterase